MRIGVVELGKRDLASALIKCALGVHEVLRMDLVPSRVDQVNTCCQITCPPISVSTPLIVLGS